MSGSKRVLALATVVAVAVLSTELGLEGVGVVRLAVGADDDAGPSDVVVVVVAAAVAIGPLAAVAIGSPLGAETLV